MPADSLLVITDTLINLIEFDIKPSQLRFGTDMQISTVSTGVITTARREELKQLLINSVMKRTVSIPFDE